MGILGKIFTWWDGATIGTSLFTARKGQKVGEDIQGNVYYEGGSDVHGVPRGAPAGEHRAAHGIGVLAAGVLAREQDAPLRPAELVVVLRGRADGTDGTDGTTTTTGGITGGGGGSIGSVGVTSTAISRDPAGGSSPSSRARAGGPAGGPPGLMHLRIALVGTVVGRGRAQQQIGVRDLHCNVT